MILSKLHEDFQMLFLREIVMVRSLLLAVVFGTIWFTPIYAQAPGSQCVTDSGDWCWASPPGNPGGPCACPNPSGSGTIPGTLQ